METLLLQCDSKKDMKLFADLAHKIGIKAKFITNADMEDIGLANAMKEARTGEFVDSKTFLKKLKKA